MTVMDTCGHLEGLCLEIMARDGEVSSISTKISTYFIIPVNNCLCF